MKSQQINVKGYLEEAKKHEPNLETNFQLLVRIISPEDISALEELRPGNEVKSILTIVHKFGYT